MAYSLTCSQLCDIYYITRRRFYSASQFSFLSIHGELNAWLCSFKNVIFLLQKFVLASWLWFSFNSFVKAFLIYIFFKTFVRFYYNTLFDKRKANKKKNLMCFLRASGGGTRFAFEINVLNVNLYLWTHLSRPASAEALATFFYLVSFMVFPRLLFNNRD